MKNLEVANTIHDEYINRARTDLAAQMSDIKRQNITDADTIRNIMCVFDESYNDLFAIRENEEDEEKSHEANEIICDLKCMEYDAARVLYDPGWLE